ncbi:hypothetical protein HMPREF9080_00662 [Cardiobacterium valvarum F0432]|uniref:Uncharacterized protein n=1 Tax=Cardiobacterium valvarum F0432 TaxID=797473 RepID=G9ZD28_9GAMM|nr:hypothetical protein HMPREF9080_00662 [Cardiobacterium valvarum F0432]
MGVSFVSGLSVCRFGEDFHQRRDGDEADSIRRQGHGGGNDGGSQAGEVGFVPFELQVQGAVDGEGAVGSGQLRRCRVVGAGDEAFQQVFTVFTRLNVAHALEQGGGIAQFHGSHF